MPAMRYFDRSLWHTRAWDRLQRQLQSDDRDGDAGAERRWAADVVAINDIAELVTWCSSRGLTVNFGKKCNGVYDHNSKSITISAGAAPQRQLLYLLHECGHHLIGMKEHHERFGMGYPQSDNPEIEKTFLHRVSCLEEELEAWHRGWKLSQRLNLNIDRASFDAVRLECVKTYIKWSIDRKGLYTVKE